MELPKPDLTQKDKEKLGRGKGERTGSAFFYDLWSVVEDKPACSQPLFWSSLPYFSIPEMKHSYSRTDYFAIFLSKMKHFLESDLCLLPYIICKSKGSKGSSVSEKVVQRQSTFSKAQQLVQSLTDGSVCSTVTLCSPATLGAEVCLH